MTKQEIITVMDEMRGKSPIADKALDYIANIENPAFWADYGKGEDARASLIVMLKHLLGPAGLRIKGFEYADIATIDQATGEINLSKVMA